jgi:hypothetical protein
VSDGPWLCDEEGTAIANPSQVFHYTEADDMEVARDRANFKRFLLGDALDPKIETLEVELFESMCL